jgi:arylsulfatase A-like enzyme
MRARSIVAMALWFGLATGFCEAGLVGVKRFVLDRIVRVGPDIAWLAPLADAIAFLVIGLALVGLGRLWKPVGRPAVVTFVLAFVAFLSLLLMYYPLHLYAKILLAAGLAMQSARLAGRWPLGFERLVRRGAIVMTVIVALLAIGTTAGSSLIYRRHAAALPDPQAASPNVLLVVWDTVRARNLSLYNYERSTTPHLERWAGTGVVFENANSTSPWTLPSHASMLTGRWPQELSATWETPLDAEPRTLAEALGERGYLTAGFVANTYYCGNELGLTRGFARYEDYVVTPRELLISSTLVRSLANSWTVRRVLGYHDNIPRQSATAITDHFLEWQATTGDRPFFAFLNYFDAHETFLPPPPFAGKFGPGPPAGSPAVVQDVRRSLRRDWFQRPADEIRGEINMYDGAIAYLDDELNRLLGELQARGTLDNTIVIVTSDHGEQFGEHGLFLHGNSLYQPLLHVPLVIRFPPAVPGGRRIPSRVTLRDLPATIVDLLGVSREAGLPGRSLARHWVRAAAEVGAEEVGGGPAIAEVREAEWAKQGNPWYPAAKGDMASVTDDRYHYIRNGDGTEELYAIEVDPQERRDLSRQADSTPLLERYRTALRLSLGQERR